MDHPNIWFGPQRAQGVIQGLALPAHPRRRRAAVWTEIPGKLHRFTAVVTTLLETGMAVRADQPVLFNTAPASWAQGGILDRLEQGFLLKRTLVFLFEGTGGA